jgi:hypothetical protein
VVNALLDANIFACEWRMQKINFEIMAARNKHCHAIKGQSWANSKQR